MPRYAKAYTYSEGPDKPAHPRSLIKAFIVRLQNHRTQQNVSMESKCPDDTLRTNRINLNLCSKTRLSLRRPYKTIPFSDLASTISHERGMIFSHIRLLMDLVHVGIIIKYQLLLSSRHVTFKQRRFNVDATS